MELLISVYMLGFLILVFIIILIVGYFVNKKNIDAQIQDLIDSRKENDGDTTLDK